MPYMYCRISEGRTPEQKQKIAEGISAVIDKYIGPPPWAAPATTPRSPMQLEGHMDLFSVPLRKAKVNQVVYHQIHKNVYPLTFAITVEK